MSLRRFWVGLLTVLGLWGNAAGVWADTPPIAYVDLKYALVRQGLNRDFVQKTFADSRNSFMPDVVRKIVYLKKETRDIYQQFLQPQVVAQGRAYLNEHRRDLSRAEARFEVKPEVIVAILTVESGLGSITGKYPVFNVFASLSVMDTPEIIRELDLPSRLKDRLKKKAAWARRELQVFLEYCYRHHLDPYFYKGSWAGAMGYSQFLPSSLKNCGADGDGDGKVDLFTHPDAIFSIACYLQKSGFQPKNRSTWRRAVLRYNNSDAYADTILALANSY